MSREDWYTLGLAMALVIRGSNGDSLGIRRVVSDALWTATTVVLDKTRRTQ